MITALPTIGFPRSLLPHQPNLHPFCLFSIVHLIIIIIIIVIDKTKDKIKQNKLNNNSKQTNNNNNTGKRAKQKAQETHTIAETHMFPYRKIP